MPADDQRGLSRDVVAPIHLPVHDLRVNVDAAVIVQRGPGEGAFVAPDGEVPFVCVVAVGHLDARQASLVRNIAGVAREMDEVVADGGNVVDGRVEIDPYPCQAVVNAGLLTGTC